MAQELTGPGEIIEVCQDCGHVIDPEEVAFNGARYRITLCQRDECIGERLMRDWNAKWNAEWPRVRQPMPFRPSWAYYPVIDPKAAFRITGI